MADDNLISQDEIERLLNQTGSPPAGAAVPAAGVPPEKLSYPPAPSPSPPSAASGGVDLEMGAAASPERNALLDQDGIEALLATANKPAPVGAARRAPSAEEDSLAPGDIDFLLNQASRAIESVAVGLESPPGPGITPFKLEDYSGAPASTESTTIDLIRDVELDLKIELGRTHMYLDDVLRLRRGSVVPLDKLAGDPVDIYVNGRLIARGEVLVLNDNFCVRVAELVAGVAPQA